MQTAAGVYEQDGEFWGCLIADRKLKYAMFFFALKDNKITA